MATDDTTIERDGEGGELVTMGGHSSVLAQQAMASVQARYVMALKRPRNMDQVRQDLLRECERPAFAAVARYHKPIGQGVEGPSIRFAEAAIRCMRNIYVETIVVSDEPTKRIVRVSVGDLETNATYFKDITVEKVVERNSLREGQVPLARRTNSRGKLVYLVEANEDDLLNKEGALVSKALRTCALRLIPGDLVDEAMDMIVATQRDKAAKDPDGERKAIVDNFFKLGVRAEELSTYLGQDLGTANPAQMVELRAVWATLRDGEATWAELLAASPGKRSAAPAEEKQNPRSAELAKKLQVRTAAIRGAAEKRSGAKQGEKPADKPAEKPAEKQEQPPAKAEDDSAKGREPGQEG